jgi:hypothetical protein
MSKSAGVGVYICSGGLPGKDLAGTAVSALAVCVWGRRML